MYIDFSKLFHRISKDLVDGGKAHIPKDWNIWPDEWKTTFYKSYGNLPQIPLSPKEGGTPIFSLLQNRKTRRDFGKAPLTLEEISLLLKYSCGETHELPGGRIGRAQPSGGAEFPIEAYVLVFKAAPDLACGVYHYNVQKNTLELLWKHEFTRQEIETYFIYEWSHDASISLIFTAVFSRSKNKYGQRGYRYILIEAGHIGQNVSLISEALRIKCCSIMGTNDRVLEELLKIDGEHESIIYSLVLGK